MSQNGREYILDDIKYAPFLSSASCHFSDDAVLVEFLWLLD